MNLKQEILISRLCVGGYVHMRFGSNSIYLLVQQ